MAKNDKYVKPNSQLVMAINFSDNDFWTTIHGILHTIAYSTEMLLREEYNPFLAGDIDRSLKIINEVFYPFYRLCQNPYSYNMEGQDDRIADYLVLKRDRLYLGAEAVEAHIKAMDGWNNGETLILDMRLPENQRIYWI